GESACDEIATLRRRLQRVSNKKLFSSMKLISKSTKRQKQL
ncbi:unnamed protein product, partial [Rotaria sp. Silwood2]